VGATELASTETTRSGHALPPGTEALASLKFGDRIVRVNGDTIRSWNALLDRVLAGRPRWSSKSQAGASRSSCTWRTAGSPPGRRWLRR